MNNKINEQKQGIGKHLEKMAEEREEAADEERQR